MGDQARPAQPCRCFGVALDQAQEVSAAPALYVYNDPALCTVGNARRCTVSIEQLDMSYINACGRGGAGFEPDHAVAVANTTIPIGNNRLNR